MPPKRAILDRLEIPHQGRRLGRSDLTGSGQRLVHDGLADRNLTLDPPRVEMAGDS
jgi:hypothetical protein